MVGNNPWPIGNCLIASSPSPPLYPSYSLTLINLGSHTQPLCHNRFFQGAKNFLLYEPCCMSLLFRVYKHNNLQLERKHPGQRTITSVSSISPPLAFEEYVLIQLIPFVMKTPQVLLLRVNKKFWVYIQMGMDKDERQKKICSLNIIKAPRYSVLRSNKTTLHKMSGVKSPK